MKKLRFLSIAALLLLFVIGIVSATTTKDRMSFEGPVAISGALTVSGVTTISGGTTVTGGIKITSEILAATKTIALTDSGKTFYLAHATEFATTLPALSTVPAGFMVRFVVSAAPSGANYTIVTGNSAEKLLYGIAVVNGASVAAAADTTVTFTAAAAVKGDYVQIESDGVSWYVSGIASAATGITFTGA